MYLLMTYTFNLVLRRFHMQLEYEHAPKCPISATGKTESQGRRELLGGCSHYRSARPRPARVSTVTHGPTSRGRQETTARAGVITLAGVLQRMPYTPHAYAETLDLLPIAVVAVVAVSGIRSTVSICPCFREEMTCTDFAQCAISNMPGRYLVFVGCGVGVDGVRSIME